MRDEGRKEEIGKLVSVFLIPPSTFLSGDTPAPLLVQIWLSSYGSF
jgi:hypothetical protein